jgi:hypothetical protein
VRLRLGETQGREALVLVLRTPEIELRAALAADETVASVTLGAGRLKLRRGGRPGIPRGRSRAPETMGLKVKEPVSLVVDALKHPGLCDDDAAPVLERAIVLAAELEGGARQPART